MSFVFAQYKKLNCAGLFRRMHIQNEKDKDDQTHRS